MTDLVHRLRDRSYAHKFPDPLSEEAADEIERLRSIDSEPVAWAVLDGAGVICEVFGHADRAHEWSKAFGPAEVIPLHTPLRPNATGSGHK